MALEVGEIVEGKVTGLTKFGAFVSLPDNKVGMVHISEVSTTFVKDIADFLEKGQNVKVQILKIDENDKISLSMKRVPENAEAVKKADNGNERNGEGRKERKRSTPNVWQGQKSKYADREDLSFEEMMSQFKQQSDDKLTDLKRATESKHGGFSRRGGNKRYG